jgi:DNA-binding response OmpR family regulator
MPPFRSLRPKGGYISTHLQTLWNRNSKSIIPPQAPHPQASVYQAAPASHTPTIYVVDDESVIAFTLSVILLGKGYKTLWFTDPVAALEAAASLPPRLLITDHNMPSMSGLQLATAIRSLSADCRTLIISADVRLSTSTEFLAAQLYDSDLLGKPFNVEALLKGVEDRLR